MTAPKYIRQDRIWWLDRARGTVTVFDPDKSFLAGIKVKPWKFSEPRDCYIVYVPPPTKLLIKEVETGMETVVPKILAYALRQWQTTGNPRVAVDYLIAASFELQRLAELPNPRELPTDDHEETGNTEVIDCHWTLHPWHQYVFNKRGPMSETVIANTPEPFESAIVPVRVFARTLLNLVANYGAPNGHPVALQFGEEHETIEEFLIRAQAELDFLIAIAEDASTAVTDMVRDYLPADRRRQCARCQQWTPLLRRNEIATSYCTPKCRQAAYRARKAQPTKRKRGQ